MAHERQDIRDAIVAQLTGTGPSYATAAGARVSKTRLAPVRHAELPMISVYTDDEAVEEASANTSPRELKRTLQVAVDGWVVVAANGQVDDALDDLALQIETAMDSDAYLDGTAGDSWLTSTEIGVKLDGERPLGCVHMVYTVVYRTDERVAAVTDKFDTVNVKYEDLDGTAPKIHEDNQAEDMVSGINEEP